MKIKSILSTIILFIVLSLTVGFSAFVSEMSISNLVAEVRLNENVRITGVIVVSSSNGGMNSLDYDEDSILGNVNLKGSSSNVTLGVEVTNFGNTVMGIESHSGSADNLVYVVSGYQEKTSLCDTSSNCTLGSVTKFNVTISYDNYDATVKNFEFKLDFVFKKMHSITYADITNNNFPSYVMYGQTLSVSLGSGAPNKLDVYSDGVLLDSSMYSYVNNTLTISEVTGDIEISKHVPVAKLVSGDLTTVGSEVCIKDECFYIISNNGNTVNMLAKYNLHVGNVIESYDYFTQQTEQYAISAPTGIQDESSLGSLISSGVSPEQFPWIGTVSFSNDLQKGTNYTDYNGSIVEGYVNNYLSYLKKIGENIEMARLITKEELEALGCDESVGERFCMSPSWVYSTSYWSGTSYDTNSVWTVDRAGYFEPVYYKGDWLFGVRPVIEISVDEIKLPAKPVVISGDYDTVGSEICIDKECFYVIVSDAKTVTMLAKYNLYVGGEYNDEWISYGNKMTGLQNSAMLGWHTLGMPYKGVIAFTDSDSIQYSGSIVETYVNNYSSYLKMQGVTPMEARLITHDELIEFGFEDWATCSYNTPEWFYSTSYWTMSDYDGLNYVWVVGENSVLDIYEPDKTDFFGVRPVITISKDNF